VSTSKKRVKSPQGRQPVTLDMIDQAFVDIDFVASFLDLLSVVGEAEQLDAVRNSSIVCLCTQSKIKVSAIKEFIKSTSRSPDVSP
jgi:hypothetical protein